MARQASATDSRSFLPKELVQALFRRLVELAGLVFILAGLALALSLISYNPDDPSASTATTAAATNWLGDTGAYAADLLLQTLGLASIFLIAALWCWGGRLIAHMGLHEFWRYAALLPLALLVWAAGFAAIPAWPTWPVGSGLGGFIGLTLEQELTGFIARAGITLPGWVLPLALVAAAVALWVPASGVSYKAWGKGFYALTWPIRTPVAWVLRKEDAKHLPAPKEKLNFLQRLRFRDKIKDRERRWTGRAPSRPHPGPEAARKPAPPVETAKKAVPAGKRAEREKQPTLDLEPKSDTKLPPLALLTEAPRKAGAQINEEALQQNARLLEAVLDDFGVRGEIVKVHPGPVVTLYELEPAPGTKSSRVIGLADDIARSMSAVSARVAVVPGRNAIGIELPNAEREMVTLREMLAARSFERNAGLLPLALGKDIGGAPVVVDLASMPHLLIAGTTGSGKSVAVNTMILSLLYRLPPSECRFIMIDPKMLELSVYDGIPHLLSPVVTDPKKAIVALKWAVREMEDRYKAMSKLGVRNLTAYNERLEEARKNGEVLTRRVQTGFDQDTGQPTYEEQELDLDPLPLIVVVVDEMADLMMVAGKDVEGSIQRLAQMARAAGIHLIMATQRPSVDVITGTIKANFPTRISFQVTSKIDSRTILGEQGAEQLLGKGDMLHLAPGGRLTRVHGPFVSDQEVEQVVRFLKKQGVPEYLAEVTEEPDGGFDTILDQAMGGGGDDEDDLYNQAVALVAREGKASTSFVQRHLQIGYNRAARIIEQMEKDGVIGPANHVGKREVLVGDHSGQ